MNNMISTTLTHFLMKWSHVFYYRSLVNRVEMQMHLHCISVRILPVAHLSRVSYGYNIYIFIDYKKYGQVLPFVKKFRISLIDMHVIN